MNNLCTGDNQIYQFFNSVDISLYKCQNQNSTFNKQVVVLKDSVILVKYNWNFFLIISAFIHCLAVSNNVTEPQENKSSELHVCRSFQKNSQNKAQQEKKSSFDSVPTSLTLLKTPKCFSDRERCGQIVSAKCQMFILYHS